MARFGLRRPPPPPPPDPVDPVQARIQAGDAARDLRHWPEAAREYDAALKLKPHMAPIWVQYAHMLKEIGRLDEAADAYGRASGLEPQDADPHLHRAHVLKRLHRPDEAADAFLSAIERDGDSPGAIEELKTLLAAGVRVDDERLGRIVPSLRAPAPSPPPADTLTGLTQRMQGVLDRSLAAKDPQARDLIHALVDGVRAADALEALEAEAAAGILSLVFDVSDLVAHFDAARLPSGIQRVQIEMIAALLADPAPAVSVRVCAFDNDRDLWAEIPEAAFLSLARQALAGGGEDDPQWREAVDALKTRLALSPPMAFPQGASLINLGASWWQPNYFLQLRRARAAYGVRYIPFVHDLIPVMAPEYCVEGLAPDFVGWLVGALAHADRFLTNSESSRRDLLKAAQALGVDLAPERVHVVRLDADFRKPVADAPLVETLERHGVTADGFVLLVSTVEPRKNHLAAFEAWITLADRHGVEALPILLCVGGRGWMNEAVFERIEREPVLRARVRMASGVSDADLANLYRACRFTLYPSLYEGWGLPVTESLCYGKAALVSDAASLPEAGGEHGLYFDARDPKALEDALDRLMFDTDWRKAAEARARSFRPRPWRALGLQIADQARAWTDQDAEAAPFPAPTAEAERYYPLGRAEAAVLSPGLVAAEVFRSGDGWWRPEDWGVWIRPQGGTLTLTLPADLNPARLILGLRGAEAAPTAYSVALGGETAEDGVLEPDARRWLALEVRPDQVTDGVLQVRVTGRPAPEAAAPEQDAPRLEPIGIIGFMVCAADRVEACLERVRTLDAPR